MLSVTATIIVFTLAWWLVFFILLPVGNHTYSETGSDPGFGGEAGAPMRPQLKRKALLATAVALLLTLIYVLAVLFGGFSLRGLLTGSA